SGAGNEATQRKGAAQGPGITKPEDDISLPKHVARPVTPASHRLVRGQWWKLSGLSGTLRSRPPEVSRPLRRFHPVGRLRRSQSTVPQRDHQAKEPNHGKDPCIWRLSGQLPTFSGPLSTSRS